MHRASALLNAISKRYPEAWSLIDRIRLDLDSGLPKWAPWCFAPFAAWYAIVASQHRVSRLATPGQVADIATLAALGAWRVTKGIYRFDPALYAALVDTQITGDLPCEILFRLPEWCVYIETPGLTWIGQPCYGVFVHLEHDVTSRAHELRLVFDCEDGLGSIPVHLGNWSLDTAIEKMASISRRNALDYANATGMQIEYQHDERIDLAAKSLQPFLSLILYLCSENAEVGNGESKPGFPKPQKTKKGMKLFAAEKTKSWDVGLRLGAALRRAYHNEQTHQGGSHSSPRPHIRRAHWHSFWSGPRNDESDNRKKQLKWLPPIAVNTELGDVVPTVRKVE